MKKLLYFVASLLSLSIIFAAGWASGAGTVNLKSTEQPAAVQSDEFTDDMNEHNKCPDCKDNESEKNFKLHNHGYKMRFSFPPIDRNDIIRLPKTVS